MKYDKDGKECSVNTVSKEAIMCLKTGVETEENILEASVIVLFNLT